MSDHINTMPSKDYIRRVKEQCDIEHKQMLNKRKSPLQRARENALYCGGVSHKKKKQKAVDSRVSSINCDLILLYSNIDTWKKSHAKIMAGATGETTYRQLDREKITKAIAMANQKITVLQGQLDRVYARVESMCGAG